MSQEVKKGPFAALTFESSKNFISTYLLRAGIFETPKHINKQIAPLIDQITVLGGVVVPIADVGCQKKCPAMVKAGLSRFQKPIGELASVYHR